MIFFITGWFADDNRKQNSVMDRFICHLSSIVNSQEKKLDRNHYEELVISSYGHLKEVLEFVEICRQKYCFTTQHATFKEELRQLLLSKQYMM